jgi:membrane peptidoglycan carboxypeptidase
MASVASTLAAGGQRRAPQALRRVLGPDGTVLYDAGEPVAEPVLDPRAAWLTTAALRRTVAEGTGRRAELRRPLAGKTGTSQDNADAWFLGYTPDLAAAVWVGFPEGRIAMEPPRTRVRVEGGNWPAELFARFGSRALLDVPAHDFPAPPDPLAVTDQQLGVIPELPAVGPSSDSTSLPPLGVVPDVTGLPLAEAVARLERVGLAPQVVSGCPAGDPRCASSAARPGTVWEQMPASGAAATPGGAVTVSAAPARGRG